ncbi:MAG: alpha/beta hydrolase [Flavobacteriales bacterium]|nr:alpha/beta hydrolase [Flavobacteriales bacterium]
MIYYTKFLCKNNNADWITFVHGAGGSSTIWYKQIKYFSRNYNLLLLDLRGHGKSKALSLNPFKKKYTFNSITDDILEVLNAEKIKKSHFVGISLGTILIRNFAEKNSNRVQSLIMGGAIMKLNLRSKILMFLGNSTKSILPYMWIYKLLAFIIMPNKNHRESRSLFIKEAKKLYQKEFKKWFQLTAELVPLLKFFRQIEISTPTFYIMGDQDYMFLPSVREVIKSHKKSMLFVVPDCGHVVNVDKPKIFNSKMVEFLSKIN